MTDRMRDVSQRNPWGPENVMGRVFRRGPTVATDGGKRPAEETGDDDARPASEQKMKDVDQTPPHEESIANRVWERGGEKPTPDPNPDRTQDPDPDVSGESARETAEE